MSSGTIAITGATGFVGTHLLERLSGCHRPLRVLAREPSKVSSTDSVEIVEGGLSSPEALKRLCSGADTLVHCAGRTAACTAGEFEEVNVEGTRAVLAAAEAAGVRRFVHISSLAARAPDISNYAASKRAGEDLVRGGGGGRSWVILRPPAVYGPGDRATLPLIKQLTQRLAFVPGTTEGRASLIHVRDLAAAIAHVTLDDELSGSVYELDDGKERGYSWRELSAAAGEAEGHRVSCIFLPRQVVKLAGAVELALAKRGRRTPEVTPDKVSELYHPDWVCRNNLLQNQSSWHPSVNLVDGLRETASWYRQQGWL